ncbi:Hypothetical protein CINCED_3A025120 [Cinara cedri]|uniref:Uncharacterized protein n=1 Tax=Cinara cedri TaxID=506608 RepID=A0A5E4N529_9HEMI|nr:Hypothetical protein CINCED_3A025120 [Cinara cedri]
MRIASAAGIVNSIGLLIRPYRFREPCSISSKRLYAFACVCIYYTYVRARARTPKRRTGLRSRCPLARRPRRLRTDARRVVRTDSKTFLIGLRKHEINSVVNRRGCARETNTPNNITDSRRYFSCARDMLSDNVTFPTSRRAYVRARALSRKEETPEGDARGRASHDGRLTAIRFRGTDGAGGGVGFKTSFPTGFSGDKTPNVIRDVRGTRVLKIPAKSVIKVAVRKTLCDGKYVRKISNFREAVTSTALSTLTYRLRHHI